MKGTLYGTTGGGGAYDRGVCVSTGCGTFFRITPEGAEKVLHSFGKRNDGAEPNGLVDVNGTFYGTTYAGGKFKVGTVFSVTPRGTEKVLYSFSNSPDGAYPDASLIEVKGKLYGTTFEGGASCTYYLQGCGTIFSITPRGREKVLHSFAGGSDGATPLASLVNVNGTLYGTTSGGGTAYEWGTVFALTP
jgi:uncharacterized repeat protein (TIGR03803 family)